MLSPRRWILFPICPWGDSTLLQTVVANLLENAWKFTRDVPGARVSVGSETREGEPIFFVRDNGAGFDPRYSSKLFVPFQRLHSPGEFEGQGIGWLPCSALSSVTEGESGPKASWAKVPRSASPCRHTVSLPLWVLHQVLPPRPPLGPLCRGVGGYPSQDWTRALVESR